MTPIDIPARARRLARILVAFHGWRAEAIALATVTAFLEHGQFDYAQVWLQVARAVSPLLSGDGSL